MNDHKTKKMKKKDDKASLSAHLIHGLDGEERRRRTCNHWRGGGRSDSDDGRSSAQRQKSASAHTPSMNDDARTLSSTKRTR